MRHTSDVDESTLAITVNNGCVVLTGSAADRKELDRLVELARHVRGVRDVQRLVVVSKKAKQQDRIVAGHVRKALATRGAAEVSAAVFGGVCVLTGRVARAPHKRALRNLVEAVPGVNRVVDKLAVRANARSLS